LTKEQFIKVYKVISKKIKFSRN